MINEKCKQFISEGKALWAGQGFNPYAVVTHAWHESAGFAKVIGKWNCWGIKSSPSWTGSKVSVFTHEQMLRLPGEDEIMAVGRAGRRWGVSGIRMDGTIQDGNVEYWNVLLPQEFRDWPTVGAATYWYMDLIKRLYPFSHEHRGCALLFFEGLTSGKYKYATDEAYVPKLRGLFIELTKNVELSELLSK